MCESRGIERCDFERHLAASVGVAPHGTFRKMQKNSPEVVSGRTLFARPGLDPSDGSEQNIVLRIRIFTGHPRIIRDRLKMGPIEAKKY